MSCVFILLQKKEYESYLEAINELRESLYKKYNITFGHLTLILDFELAIQQALRQAFHGACTIKGCWFHFCQALLRQIGEIGLKSNYNQSFHFKFWVKRFMALALISMENIKEAMDIIISEIDSNSNIAIKQADFVVYFVNQWLNAKKSKQGPEIWNQHQATIKTNNVSEANHSSMPSTIPRHNPLVCQIIKYFKECDSVSSDKFLKLKNNFSASQMRSSKSQKDFDYFLALTHEEFSIELSSTSVEKHSDCF